MFLRRIRLFTPYKHNVSFGVIEISSCLYLRLYGPRPRPCAVDVYDTTKLEGAG